MASVNTAPSAQAVTLQTLSFLAIAASVSPLALHWKNRNFPASMLMSWFIILNLFNVMNAFIWPTDDIANWWDGKGLCDIEVKILIGSYVALPGCLVCIFRSLAIVMDTSRATFVPSRRQRWQNRAVEILFCVLVPVMAAIMHIVYQGNRYFIFAVSGCVTSLDESWVSLALGYIWPLVVCFIATYYCGLVLFRLRRYRNQFNEIVRSANSSFNRSRFLRLFLLSFLMLVALIPMQSYMIYMQIQMSLPWHAYSWSFLHGTTWGVITKIPTNGVVYFDRWVPIAGGFVGFFFFGCGKDATRMYRSVLQRAGLGSFFGSIQSTSTGSFPRNTSGSAGSRANLLQGAKNKSAQTDAHRSTSTTSSSTDTTNTDFEKGTHTLFSTPQPQSQPQPQHKNHSRTPTWLKPLTHFSWFGHNPNRHSNAARSSPHLALPSNTVNTVQTNAWAGSSLSQSRGSMDIDIDLETLQPRTDFIRVKQVIRLKREVQV
ncbi:pheromone A receptor-domain-containing protein [Aspergillus crustosus]